MSGLHTPGPLAVEFDPMNDGDHATLVVIPSRSGLADTWVASCFHNWNEAGRGERRISWKEAEANALLFAAAADLLAAAELILDWEHLLPESIDRVLRAAVAKAKGAAK